MAILESNLYRKGTRQRGLYSGKPYEVAAKFDLPAGTVLNVGDDLYAIPVGENQRVTKVTTTAIGATGALAGSIGYFQMLDGEDNPVRVERQGPRVEDQIFVSPATNVTAYRAAGTMANRVVTEVLSQQPKLAGPVIVGARVTTGATLAEDVELYISVEFDGESPEITVGGLTYIAKSDYLLGN